MRSASAVLALFLAVFAACRERERTAPIPRRNTPVPESASASSPGHTARGEGSPARDSLKALLKVPPMLRFQTPGAVRWIEDLDAPITGIHWSPLKGFSVTAGDYVHNITSRGENRWRVVAGKGHQVFGFGEIEAVWSPAFGRISQIRRRGIIGWTREVSGRLVEDTDGNVYLFDASAVSAIREDGKDKWRASLEGVRRIEGPFNCGDGVLVHGMSGLKRVSVHLSDRGSVVHTTPLGRGALLLGAGKSCEPLVWRDGMLSLLNQRGYPLWKRQYANTPFVHRLPQGFAVINGRAGLPAELEIISLWGKTFQKTELPMAGRLTRTDVIPKEPLGVEAIGLCLDVTAPCAKPRGTRGPYNAVVTADGKGGFRTLIRHNVGHLGIARFAEEGIVTASSSDEYSVDLVLRDDVHSVVWQLNLPGRLSAGPYTGPYGGIYLGTCRGWDCEKPYRLYAVTGREEEPEPDADEPGTTGL